MSSNKRNRKISRTTNKNNYNNNKSNNKKQVQLQLLSFLKLRNLPSSKTIQVIIYLKF